LNAVASLLAKAEVWRSSNGKKYLVQRLRYFCDAAELTANGISEKSLQSRRTYRTAARASLQILEKSGPIVNSIVNNSIVARTPPQKKGSAVLAYHP